MIWGRHIYTGRSDHSETIGVNKGVKKYFHPPPQPPHPPMLMKLLVRSNYWPLCIWVDSTPCHVICPNQEVRTDAADTVTPRQREKGITTTNNDKRAWNKCAGPHLELSVVSKNKVLMQNRLLVFVNLSDCKGPKPNWWNGGNFFYFVAVESHHTCFWSVLLWNNPTTSID